MTVRIQNEILPSRTNLVVGESLLSYLIRTAELNGISINLLLNMLRKNKKFLLHSGDIHRVDWYPESVLDIEKLVCFTGLNNDNIGVSSFTNILRMYKEASSGERAQFARDLMRDILHYCPQCLKEGQGLALIWKIEGIRHCLKHRALLDNKCGHCFEQISYSQIQSVDICPHCNKKLSEVNAITSIDIDSRDITLSINLNQIIQSKEPLFESQELARKLLYLFNGYNSMYNAETVKNALEGCTLTHLLQRARGTIKNKNALSLKLILDTVCRFKIDIKDLQKLTVPAAFVCSLIQSNSVSWTQNASCLAPWCRLYGIEGSLIPTASKHTKKRGQDLSHYLICRECYCEYAFDCHKNLIERTNFISAYQVLMLHNISFMTWSEKEKHFNLKREPVRRVIAYFTVRQLFKEHLSNCHYEVKKEFVSEFIDALNQGIDLAAVRSWPIWNSYEQYLLHRYHPEIMDKLFKIKTEKIPVFCDVTNVEFESQVNNACKELIENGDTITLPKIAATLKTSVVTLYKRNAVLIVREHQLQQQRIKREYLIQEMKKRALVYINNSFEHVYSQKLYSAIGVRYGCLKKISSELVEWIEEMRVQRNSELRGDLSNGYENSRRIF